jgi:hypothetical protein
MCFFVALQQRAAAERQDVVAVTLFDLQHLGKVKVYQFILLEPNEIERRKSSRWGTREAIGGLKDHALPACLPRPGTVSTDIMRAMVKRTRLRFVDEDGGAFDYLGS